MGDQLANNGLAGDWFTEGQSKSGPKALWGYGICLPRRLAENLINFIRFIKEQGEEQKAERHARALLRLLLLNLFEGMRFLGNELRWFEGMWFSVNELKWDEPAELFQTAKNAFEKWGKGPYGESGPPFYSSLLDSLRKLYALYQEGKAPSSLDSLYSFVELMSQENPLPPRPRMLLYRDYKRVEKIPEETWRRVEEKLGGTDEAKGLALALAGLPGGPYGLAATLLWVGPDFLPYLVLTPEASPHKEHASKSDKQKKAEGRGEDAGDEDAGDKDKKYRDMGIHTGKIRELQATLHEKILAKNYETDPFSLQLIYAWARGSIKEDGGWPLPVEGCSEWDERTTGCLFPLGEKSLACPPYNDRTRWPEEVGKKSPRASQQAGKTSQGEIPAQEETDQETYEEDEELGRKQASETSQGEIPTQEETGQETHEEDEEPGRRYILLDINRSDRTKKTAKLATAALKQDKTSCRAKVGLYKLKLYDSNGWDWKETHPLFLNRPDVTIYAHLDSLAARVLGEKARPLKGFSCFLVEEAKMLGSESMLPATQRDKNHLLALNLYAYLERLLADGTGQGARGVDVLWENLRLILEGWVGSLVNAELKHNPSPQSPRGDN